MSDSINTDAMLQKLILDTFNQMKNLDANGESYALAAQSLNILLMVLGIISVLFGTVIFFMWRHYETKVEKMQLRHDTQMNAVKEEHTKEIQALTGQFNKLNDQLTQERVKNIEMLKDVHHVLQTLTNLAEKNTDKVVEVIKESTASIGNRIASMERIINK